MLYSTIVLNVSRDSLSTSLIAMAHPVRRGVMDRLQRSPARVTDLAAGFDISLAAVSRHVKVLEDAGLVARTIEGRDHIIAGRPEGWSEAADWIDERSRAWGLGLMALKTILEAEDGDR